MSQGGVEGRHMTQGTRSGRVLAEKYRLLGKLGEGGMGEVYEAEHSLVGRRFAVKFLHRELARDEQIMSRFRREARAAGGLESENIVAVTDFGHADDGAPFIVMEYLSGGDMRSLLRRAGRLPVSRAVDLVIQACRGLDLAHARGIVHRDLKPENLFVTKRGDGSDLVKVLDFGIAKLRGNTTSGASTKAGAVMGTLLYMPPEQVRGDKNTDHRADIYALGAILYEALTGNLPHPGDEPHSIMYHIMYEQPAPIASLRPDVPGDIAIAVHKALATEADARFQTVAQFAEAIAPFASRQITPFRTSDPNAIAPTLPTPVSGVGSIKPTPRSDAGVTSQTQRAIEAAGLSTSRPRGKAVIAGALVLLAVAGTIAWALGSGGTPAAEAPPTLTAATPSPESAPAPPPPPAATPAPMAAVPPAPPQQPAPVIAPEATAQPATERPAERPAGQVAATPEPAARAAPTTRTRTPRPQPSAAKLAPSTPPPPRTMPAAPRTGKTTRSIDRDNPFD